MSMNRSKAAQRGWKATGLGLGLLALLVAIALAFIDEPLRGYIERQANQLLDGYRLTIGALDFHPLGLSVDLEEVALVDVQRPEQPMIRIPHWSAGVHWRELLRGHVVSDHRFERPSLHITRSQAIEEAEGEGALKEPGWQEAVLAIYPLAINEVIISDGDISYADSPNSKPLRLQAVQFRAGNIRNIESPEHTYPSTVTLQAEVFDSGRLTVNGKADFLAQPHVGIDADVNLNKVLLKDLLPLTGRSNLILTEGRLDAQGHVEYSPAVKDITLQNIAVNGLRMDYVHAPGAVANPSRVDRKTSRQENQSHGDTPLTIRIEQGTVTDSDIGFVNKETEPHYRLFLGDLKLTIRDLSNRFDRTATITLEGRFMGSGTLTTHAVLRPEDPLPDFDLDIKILHTKLKSMNNLLRAHAGADVQAGTFAFFSEVTVKEGRIHGYVRPFFKDIDVYDPAQDQDKGFFQQVYEGVIESFVELFENEPRKEAATETSVSGPLSDPRANTWEVVVNLIKNAFFKAIVPGFKKTVHS